MEKLFRRGGGGVLYLGPEVAAIVLLMIFEINAQCSLSRFYGSLYKFIECLLRLEIMISEIKKIVKKIEPSSIFQKFCATLTIGLGDVVIYKQKKEQWGIYFSNKIYWQLSCPICLQILHKLFTSCQLSWTIYCARNFHVANKIAQLYCK